MFYNNSYKEKLLDAALNDLVGSPFSIWHRFKHRVGSNYLKVVEFRNFDFEKPLTDDYFKKIVIELRPKGIVIHFKIQTETFVWAVPYYQLHLYNTDFFSIHAQGKAILIEKEKNFERNQAFLNKLIKLKNIALEPHFERPNGI